MIRALFRHEPPENRKIETITPKVLAELGVEPFDQYRKRTGGTDKDRERAAKPAPGKRRHP